MLIDYNLTIDPGTGETLTNTRLMAQSQLDTITTPVARDIGAGKSQFLNFICLTAVAGATAGSTVDLQALALVLPIPAATAFTATHTLASPAVWTSAAHSWATGTPVRVALNGGTVDANFVPGTTYYVIRLSATTFNLAATLALALAGTGINASAASTGSPVVTSVPTGVTQDIQPAAVSVADNTITITDHGMQNGQPLQIFWAGTLAITGVTTGAVVYAIRVDANTFKVATTWALAMAGTAADITVTTNDVTTVVVQPIPLGSSGPLLKELLFVGSIIPVALNPVGNIGVNSSATITRLTGRYITAAFSPSATMTAGKFKVEIVPTAQNAQRYYSIGTPVV